PIQLSVWQQQGEPCHELSHDCLVKAVARGQTARLCLKDIARSQLVAAVDYFIEKGCDGFGFHFVYEQLGGGRCVDVVPHLSLRKMSSDTSVGSSTDTLGSAAKPPCTVAGVTPAGRRSSGGERTATTSPLLVISKVSPARTRLKISALLLRNSR